MLDELYGGMSPMIMALYYETRSTLVLLRAASQVGVWVCAH